MIRVTLAGAALRFGCAGRNPAAETEPPAVVPVQPQVTTNPPPTLDAPPPPPEPTGPTASDRPTWEQVASPHPPGATNPPIPVLIVTPDHDCFKQWRSPMAPGPRGDRVDACEAPESCGIAIICPEPRATEVLAGK